ncbi:hypothetical protein HZ326_26259 [Fusarium oxysporum f. sp. albedinis]|nr:hypothetical protein HZ326_26259 [Fusarium oxysporum f. sp. albedinis]
MTWLGCFWLSIDSSPQSHSQSHADLPLAKTHFPVASPSQQQRKGKQSCVPVSELPSHPFCISLVPVVRAAPRCKDGVLRRTNRYLAHMLTLTITPHSITRQRELWAASSSLTSYLKLDGCSLQDSLLGSCYSAHEQLG